MSTITLPAFRHGVRIVAGAALFSVVAVGIGHALRSIGVSWPCLRSGLFSVREILIQTEPPLDEAWTRSMLPSTADATLFQIHPADFLAKLQKHPWVESVTLQKHYPDGLSVTVRTRKATAIEIDGNRALYLDGHGQPIEAVSPRTSLATSVPLIVRYDASRSLWTPDRVEGLLGGIERELSSCVPVSQVVLGTYPLFRLFLSEQPLEVLLHFDNWHAQLAYLKVLLHRPPPRIGQPRKINLIFSKKAVVS